MSKEQIEEERRRGRIAGIAAIAGLVIFIAAMGLAGEFNGAEQAEQLQLFDSVKGDLLLQTVLQAFALLLFIPALVSLFRSIQARVETFKPGLIGVVVISPILLAASLITAYFAFQAAADAFLAPGADYDTASDDAANDVFYEQFETQLRTGLGLAGSLGLAFTTVYLSLNAMRAGMMTRFWGTLAMAIGVGTLLFGSVMLIGFMLLIALLITGWWPGSRPPAWEAGEAVPWPTAGRPGDAEPAADELASPEDFEGSATEIESGSEDPEDPGPSGRRKRKQRG